MTANHAKTPFAHSGRLITHASENSLHVPLALLTALRLHCRRLLASMPKRLAEAMSFGEAPKAKCQFFLPQKRRNCKFEAVNGKSFCGNHLFAATGAGTRRVPCTFDPTQCDASQSLGDEKKLEEDKSMM